MPQLLLVLAARIVLTGNQPVAATLVEVVEGGTVKVKTSKGIATVRLLGLECGPVKASDKCIRSGEVECFKEAALGRKAATRTQELLQGQSLNVVPCFSFSADKQKRTYGFVQWGENEDLTTKLVSEGLCKRLSTACMKPSRE